MNITEIWVYPIKSCKGIKLEEAVVNVKGLEMDRRWMLIDDKNNKISQREIELMSQISIEYHGDSFKISSRLHGTISLPMGFELGDVTSAKIWDDICEVVLMPETYHQWFSSVLGVSCRLVFIANDTWRPTRQFDVGLADGYHSLLISQESVDLLNSKLQGVQVSTRNFRPNFVFTGAEAHMEDNWVGKDLFIGNAKFFGVKACSRCKVITINPDTGEVNPKITATLAPYRFQNEPSKGIYFGLNLAALDVGQIVRVGDKLSF